MISTESSLFCDRFSSYRYVKTAGNYPFKTAFVVNALLNVPFCFNAILTKAPGILSIWQSHTLRKAPTNLLLIGLALSDLGVGLIVQPFFIAFLLSFAETGAGTFTCLTSVAVSVFGSVLTSVSFGTVVSVSIERYIALRLHLRYEDVVKVKRAWNFLITLWLIGGTLPFIWVWLTPKYRSHFFSTGILLYLVISSVAYIKIYRIIRYHRRQIISTEMNARNHEKMTQRKRNTFNMLVVHCVLVLCYLPYSICLLVVKSYDYTNCSWIGINFALTVVNINSSVNPFIYCYRMRQIRRAMIMTLYKILLQVSKRWKASGIFCLAWVSNHN